jgi:hypothetical protein
MAARDRKAWREARVGAAFGALGWGWWGRGEEARKEGYRLRGERRRRRGDRGGVETREYRVYSLLLQSSKNCCAG